MAKIYTTAPHLEDSNGNDGQGGSNDDAQRHSNKTVGIYDRPRRIHAERIQRFWGIGAVLIILLLLVVAFLSLG